MTVTTRLADAIVLIERPAIGADAHRERGRLPPSIATLAFVDAEAVDCTIARAAVQALTGMQHPSWGDLQRAWPLVSARLRLKIRAGDMQGRGDGASGRRSVRLDGDDVAVTLDRGVSRNRHMPQRAVTPL